MKTISSKLKGLLEVLYNYKSDDSILIKNIIKNKEDASVKKDQACDRKLELESTISDLSLRKSTLAEEGENLRNTVYILNRDAFTDVIECLDLGFNAAEVLEKINVSLPNKLDEMQESMDTASEELVSVNQFIEDSIAKIYELGLEEEEAYADRDRLEKYINLAIDGQLNITRDEITNLLEKMDFNDSEKVELAKVIMFPEDGLLEFNEMYLNGEVDITIDEYALDDEEEDVTSEDETIEDSNLEEDEESTEIIIENDSDEEVSEDSSLLESEKEDEIIIVTATEESEKSAKNDTIEFLKDLGFDSFDFTSNDVEKVKDNFDEELITKNVRIINTLGIGKDIFLDNIELFYDNELESKLDLLTSLGKLPQDIYLNPTVLVKYDLNSLNSAINTLKDSGLDPKNVPLMAF